MPFAVCLSASTKSYWGQQSLSNQCGLPEGLCSKLLCDSFFREPNKTNQGKTSTPYWHAVCRTPHASSVHRLVLFIKTVQQKSFLIWFTLRGCLNKVLEHLSVNLFNAESISCYSQWRDMDYSGLKWNVHSAMSYEGNRNHMWYETVGFFRKVWKSYFYNRSHSG